MPSLPSTPLRVVLLPGASPRLFGETVHARNARVAARAGATVVEPRDAAPTVSGPALIVPPDIAINSWLFPIDDLSDRTTPLLARAGMGRDGEGALDAATPAARRDAARRIIRRTAKTTDGWVSRHLNRPISRVLSLALLSLGLRASHASLLTLLFGLGAAAIGALPGYLPFALLGVLFHLASVLDGVDGEMARATLTESDAGARVDTLVDQATYVACFIGVMVGWIREGGARDAAIWTVVIAASLLLTLLRGGRFVSRYAPNASFVFIDRSVRRAARDSGKPLLTAAAGVFTLLRRDAFALAFLFVALSGQRALVPALVAGGVIVANLTFSLYGRELAAAAIAERG